jgi:hypothetical protein
MKSFGVQIIGRTLGAMNVGDVAISDIIRASLI